MRKATEGSVAKLTDAPAWESGGRQPLHQAGAAEHHCSARGPGTRRNLEVAGDVLQEARS